MFVFLEGTDWGEKLFKKLFNSEDVSTDICENVRVEKGDIVFDIETEDRLYKKAVVLKYEQSKKPKDIPFNVPLPVTLRIYHTEIPLSDIDKIGESSEIILENGDTFKVDILLNGKVIGEGDLYQKEGVFKLKIKKMYI